MTLPVPIGRTEHTAERRPDYPPRTPPPPRRPVESPRPERVFTVVNQRAANWALEARPWAATRVRRLVVDRLTAWRYLPDPDRVGAVVSALVAAAVQDGGRRISLHLAAVEGQVCVAVLSHLAGARTQAQTGVLGGVADLPGLRGCGSEADPDGHRLWAVIDVPLRGDVVPGQRGAESG
ncbi:hypothetical protein ACFWAR_03065 [Streptomyces sp. NPDC059917]|uniref:hypothetical protein n=1 Tax=Streptomyces sp. NPDC059917 TaxID=3347002 RepID=UPI003648DCD9